MNSYSNSYPFDEIIPIALELAGKYKGYESTSVSYDTMGFLTDAVLYFINESGSNPAALTTRLSAKEAYLLGRQMVISKSKATLARYNALMASFDDYGLTVLRDTVVKGFPAFFQYYDPYFRPQNTILTLDYPIPAFDRNLSGIDAISEYLTLIIKEQEYLRSFPRETVIQKLRDYHPDYGFLIENITEMISWHRPSQGESEDIFL